MAEKTLKGTKEWDMFTDYYRLCAIYWDPACVIPDKSDKVAYENYWKTAYEDVKKFADKHNFPFAAQLGLVFYKELERRAKERENELCLANETKDNAPKEEEPCVQEELELF